MCVVFVVVVSLSSLSSSFVCHQRRRSVIVGRWQHRSLAKLVVGHLQQLLLFRVLVFQLEVPQEPPGHFLIFTGAIVVVVLGESLLIVVLVVPLII